jgi:hypothetical protein
MYWFFTGLPELGKEHVLDVTSCKLFEFNTDDIPAEIKDYQPVSNNPAADDGNDPGRLLSQSEIDALIAELSGG